MDGSYEVGFTVTFSTCNVEFTVVSLGSNTIVYGTNPHKLLLPVSVSYGKHHTLQTECNVLKVIYDDLYRAVHK